MPAFSNLPTFTKMSKARRRSALGTVSRGARWTFIGVVCLVLTAGAAYVLLKWAPSLLAASPDVSKDRASELGRVRTSILTMLAGLLAIAGAVYTAKTFALSRRGQVTERFTRAVDQLGSKSVDVRLGGIYALERVARESPSDHNAIMEILTAYVRERAPWPSRRGAGGSGSTLPRRDLHPDADIQAALTVVGRREVRHDRSDGACVLDLSGSDLRGASLTRGQFARAKLTDTHLECADLRDVDLTKADATDAHFEGADLTGANLRGIALTRARLHEAELRFARMSGAVLRDCDLGGANLFGADLDEADLWKANLMGASLWNAHLKRADLTDTRFDDTRHNDSTVWPKGFLPPVS